MKPILRFLDSMGGERWWIFPLVYLAIMLAIGVCGVFAAPSPLVPVLLFSDDDPRTVLYERQARLPSSLVWSASESIDRDLLCGPRAVAVDGTCKLRYACAWPRDPRMFYRVRALSPAPTAAPGPGPMIATPWTDAPQLEVVCLPPGPWTATGGVGGALSFFPPGPGGLTCP